MSELSPGVRRTLRSRAHHLRPYLSIGEAGLTPALLKEIDLCLRSHELIKVRVLVGDRHDRGQLIDDICRELGAFQVQHIGRILVIFRPTPDESATRTTPRSREEQKRRPDARRTRHGSQGRKLRRT